MEMSKRSGEIEAASFTPNNLSKAEKYSIEIVKGKGYKFVNVIFTIFSDSPYIDNPMTIFLHQQSKERKLVLVDGSISEILQNISALLIPLDIEISNGPLSQQPELTPGYLFVNPDIGILNMTVCLMIICAPLPYF